MTTAGWNEQELGYILTLNYGWSLPEKKRVPGDAPVYGSNGIVGTHQQALVASHGLIIGRKGSAGNVHYSRRPFCPIDTTFYIAPGDTSLDIEFLYFLLLHIDLKRILGDVGVPGLNREMAYKEKAQFPTGAVEQRKIAAVLALVQRAIEQQERLIALTTELKKALLHQLFTQGLRSEPQKQTEIGPVPESWEVVAFSDIAMLQSGGTPARDKPEYWTAGDIPWVKTGEIDYRVIRMTEERITREGLANSAAKVFPKGTLLMAMYGQGVTRGRVGLLGIDAATNQACAAITPRDEQKVSTQFIYHFLEFHYEDLRQLGHGANQRNLNASLIKGFRLSFPKPDEQAEIVDALGVVNAKLALHQSKHTALTSLFRTLLHQLMTAQIRVDHLELRIEQT